MNNSESTRPPGIDSINTRFLTDPSLFMNEIRGYIYDMPGNIGQDIIMYGIKNGTSPEYFHEMISFTLNHLYQRDLTLENLASISRGRRLFDEVAKFFGQDIDYRRHEVDECAIREDVSGLPKKFPEIKIHQDTVEGANIMDTCFSYAFGFSGKTFEDFLRSDDWVDYSEGDGTVGDIALYFFDNSHVVHAGIVIGDGLVRSRWGKTAVIDHPVELVPTYYGRVEQYFKKRQSDTIGV